jgi:hypothetical protein
MDKENYVYILYTHTKSGVLFSYKEWNFVGKKMDRSRHYVEISQAQKQDNCIFFCSYVESRFKIIMGHEYKRGTVWGRGSAGRRKSEDQCTLHMYCMCIYIHEDRIMKLTKYCLKRGRRREG